MNLIRIILFISFILSLVSCSKDNDLELSNNMGDNILLTYENTDPRVDDSFTVTKESILLSDREIYDNVNDTTWKYNILLPPGYNENKQYPVLYLLHGKDAHYYNWYTSIKLKRVLDVNYTKGLEDIIVVTPEGGNTYYLDNYLDDIKYETFFHQVLCPHIESHYPVSLERKNHFIGGWSMGGYGALYYALKYCEDFAFCYSMSAPVAGRELTNVPSLFSLINDTQGNPFTPYIVMDMGESDSFLQSNMDAHWLMSDLDVTHELILREGGHDAEFWQKGLYFLFDRLGKFMEAQ